MRPTGHPLIDNSPSQWRVATVDEIKANERHACVAGPFGSSISSKFFTPTGVPIIRGSNLTIDLEQFIPKDFRFVSEETAAKFTAQTVRSNDLVFTCWGTIGQVGLIPEDGPFDRYVISNKQLKLRVDQEVLDPHFAFYFFAAPETVHYIKDRAIGSAVPGINLGILKALPVLVPPLGTQKRIASILGAYDDLIEVNRRRIEVLEEMARGIFEEWFVRFRFPGHEDVPIVETPDGPLPEGWDWKVLGDFLELRKDRAKPGPHLSDRNYVPIECIGKRTLALPEYQSWENAKSSLQLFDEGDILFGAMRAYFHKVSPAPFAGVTRSTCFVLRPIRDEDFAYSLMALFRDETVAFAAAKSSGSTIPYAKWDGVLEQMSLPGPTENLRTSFHELVRPMVQLIFGLVKTNSSLAASRDLLLPRLISGQLSVEAAESELEDAA